MTVHTINLQVRDFVGDLLINNLSEFGKKHALDTIIRHDLGAMRYEIKLYDKEILFRVEIERSRITVVCLSTECVDPPEVGEYTSVNDLPNWVQERIAVLLLMSSKPPTQFVEGIGRRISENVFWVFKPDQ
jgi:hypothetical protein